jgi:hypothetical protein
MMPRISVSPSTPVIPRGARNLLERVRGRRRGGESGFLRASRGGMTKGALVAMTMG